MEYYHLVTRKPMFIGQNIVFGKKNKNRLYHFFLNNNLKNESNESVDQVIERMDMPFEDKESTFVINSISHTSRAIREVITEMVRLESFQKKPSRFECLYGAESLEELTTWKELFESHNRVVLQVVKLKSNGPIFKGNASLLPSLKESSFLEKISQAKEYWEYPSENGLSEILIGGEIIVTEIIEDFQ